MALADGARVGGRVKAPGRRWPGYDPAGLRDFLAALWPGGQDSATATFFSTHPGTAERREAQTKRLASQPVGRRNLERFGQAVRPS